MTDSRVEEPSEEGYSKDYWDLVFEQLSRRRLFQFGLVVLALLYGSAIYAPLLANDRPYVLEAINYAEYDQARKGLYPVTLGFRGLAKKTPDEYLAKRTEGSTQTYAEALEAERSALATRIQTLRTYAPSESHAALAEFDAAAGRAVDLALAGDHEGAAAAAGELKDAAKAIRTDFEALREVTAEDGTVSSTGNLALEGVVSYPLMEATTAWEMFFMVLWAFVLGWPVWNWALNRIVLGADRERIRAWRKRKLVLVLSVSTLAAVLWAFLVGGQTTFHVSPFKESLTSGEIAATRVIFPPLAFGFAETHVEEILRPPTWTKGSEISEAGTYMHGARAPVPDPITGYLPEGTPVEVRFSEPERNSGLRHPMGTDSLGRDLLVRALWGGRVSLAVGIVSTVILMVIGVVIGAIAGFFGGRVDLVISRFIEVVICFPVFFLILVVVAFVGPSILNIMIVIGLVRWTGVARLTRGEFLRLRELDFVVAATALGLSSRRTVFRHMLPNAMGPLLVAATFSVAAGILVESGLSFLGFGIQLPIPSWGSLVTESRNLSHWWIQLFPGLLIFITVLCYNLVGDGIRDAMDPKMRVTR